MTVRLERVELDQCDWDDLDNHPDRVLFQTRAWLDFLARTQGGEPVVAAARDGATTVGWFTGLVVRRVGVRILGSPFPGWNSSYMGFTMHDPSQRAAAWAALPAFGLGALGCHHLEVRDRSTGFGDLPSLGFEHGRTFNTYTVNLRAAEDDLFARMTSACRRNVRKAVREGVTIEEGGDGDFVEEYYAQLRDVFAKQGIQPLYPISRVHELVRALDPTGGLLLLRARDADGACVATGIFPFMNGTMYFWGGASWREHQHLRPNEALMWHAMRAARSRGLTTLDLCGGGDFKAKYGATQVPVASFTLTRWRALSTARRAAEHVVRRRRGVTV